MRHDKAIKFLTEAAFLANTFSKDASSKVGAVFVDPSDFTQLSHGYNGMPRGIQDQVPERHERPLKYDFFEHAERNAIYNKAREVLKGSIALTTSVPSIGCVRALVSVGVSELWAPLPNSTGVAAQMLAEAGVTVRAYDPGQVTNPSCPRPVTLPSESGDDRRQRKLRQYLTFTHQLPALFSRDPHANATCFVHATDFTLLTRGYSGMPRGARDDRIERYEAPERARWVEESVRNAIYNLVRPMLKGSTALVTATTCVECARAFASVGVREVYYTQPTDDFLSRWGPSIGFALEMLDELGITYRAVQRNELA